VIDTSWSGEIIGQQLFSKIFKKMVVGNASGR